MKGFFFILVAFLAAKHVGCSALILFVKNWASDTYCPKMESNFALLNVTSFVLILFENM